MSVFYLLLVFLLSLFFSLFLLSCFDTPHSLHVFDNISFSLCVIAFPSHSTYLLIHSHSLSLVHIINSISTCRPPSLLSSSTLIVRPAYVYLCAFQWFYFRTTSTLLPTSGLPVCTAASQTAYLATILQCCYNNISTI